MDRLVDLLSPPAISLDAHASDWEDAVRQAGALLTNTDVAGEGYTQAMVDSVHQNGPYIVVAPGFAFAHARPSEDVHRTGMSWLRLQGPVEFGHRSNDPVDLVVAMAAQDTKQHQAAMAQLAKVLANRDAMARLRSAQDPQEVLAVLDGAGTRTARPAVASTGPAHAVATSTPDASVDARQQTTTGRRTKDHIMTVCGNGVGTSLFLKSTLESVLDKWGWGPYLTVEATDTVSAKGKAGDCDLIMTSGEIAKALGDLGVPMVVIENFTSEREVDAALREVYDI